MQCHPKHIWTYWVHGIMMAELSNRYWWARSHKVVLMRNLMPAPFSTSPTSPSSLASHIFHFTTSNLCKYSMMKLKHSYRTYPLAIEALGLTILRIYNFNVFMYLSTRYIHLVTTRPHKSNLFTRWYSKWIVMSKKDGGKWISNKAKLTETYNWNDLMSKGFQTLLQSFLNTLEILITTIRGLGANKSFNVNGKIYYINTW